MATLADMLGDLRKKKVDIFTGDAPTSYSPPQTSRIVDLILGKSDTVNVAQAPFIPKMVDRQIANIERPPTPIQSEQRNPILDIGSLIGSITKPVVDEYNRGANELDRLGGGSINQILNPVRGVQNVYNMGKYAQEGAVRSGARIFNEATKPILNTAETVMGQPRQDKGLLETLSGGSQQDLLNTKDDTGLRGQITKAVIGEKPLESFSDQFKRGTEGSKGDTLDIMGYKVKNPQALKDNPQLGGALLVGGIAGADLTGYGKSAKGIETIAKTGLKNPKAYEVIANILKKEHGIVDEALTNKLINVNKADDVKNAIGEFKNPIPKSVAVQTLEQDTLRNANGRLAELEQKANGVGGIKPQILTHQEATELKFLRENKNNVDVLSEKYGAKVSTPTTATNIAQNIDDSRFDPNANVNQTGEGFRPQPADDVQNLAGVRTKQPNMNAQQIEKVLQREKAQSGYAPDVITKYVREHPNITTKAQQTTNKVELPKITGATEKERIQSAIVNSENIRQAISTKGKEVYTIGRKLKNEDLNIIRDEYQAGGKIADIASHTSNPKVAEKYLNGVKDYYDFQLAADRAVGATTLKESNHIRQAWDLSKPEDLAKYNQYATQRGLKEYKGFGNQPKVFKTYKEGIDAGFTPKNKNINEDLLQHSQGASESASKRNLLTGLNEAAPDKVSMQGTGYTKEGQPFVNSNIKGLEGASFHPDVNSRLKGYQPVNKSGGAAGVTAKIYDTTTQKLKTFLLNFSGFHSLNISGNFIGASLKHPIKGTEGIAKSLPSFFSEKYTQHIIEGAKKKMIKGTNKSIFDAGLEAGVIMERGVAPKGAKRLNPLKVSSRAIFDRELYTLKLSLVDQSFGNGKVIPSSPQGRAIANEINAIVGEMAPKTQNINPNTLKWAQRGMLAPSYTLSKYKLLKDAGTKGGKGGSLARTAVVGNSLVEGTIATFATLLATGQYPNLEQTVMNYTLAPDVQTNLENTKGKKLDVSLPKTFISEVGRPIADAIKGNTWEEKTAPFIHYGEARLNPLPSDVLKVATNQDYLGNPIVDKYGKTPVAEQIARNIGIGHLPIGVQGLANMAINKQTKEQAILGAIGLRTKVNPNDPTTVYFGELNKVRNQLNPNDQAAFDTIHKDSKDQSGNYVAEPTVWDSATKASIYLANPHVLEADTKINQGLAQKGQNIDPFWNIGKDKQNIMNTYATLPPNDPQKKAMMRQNPWMQDVQNQRSAFFDQLPAGDPNKPKSPVQYPQPSAEVENLQNKYYTITDSKQKALFLKQNPQVTDQFAKLDQYNRAIRDAKNLPQYDAYPTASPQVQALLDQLDTLPEHDGPKGGNASRAKFMAAHPEISDYFMKTSVYNLEQSAGQANFQDTGFDQKGLKAISSLGQFDVGSYTDANGNKIYTLGGENAGSGSGYSKYAKGGSKAKKVAKPKTMKIAKGRIPKMKSYKPKTVKTKSFSQILKNTTKTRRA